MQNAPIDPKSAPPPPRQPSTSPAPAATSRSVLAADLKIKGDLSSDGTIEVLGEIDGKVTARALIVGAEGRVKGTVSAETVEVRGLLDGRISCTALTLRAAASVKADSTYTTLIIESGATVEGRFTLAKL
ncbi:MAG: polymer-forming cytoskeletal protein [Paracoccaceae bacterium]